MQNIKANKIIEKLFPYNYSVVSDDNEKVIDLMKQYLPFKVYKYKSGKSINGWQIPNKCHVISARIFKDNKLIHDAKNIPLGIPALSASFKGYINANELKKHLFTHDNTNSIPYHWQNLYRPNDKQWGFCVPKSFLKKINKGKYFVDLNIKETPSKMSVLVYTLSGKSKKTILLNAHNCHPYQANDDLSGIAVGIELFSKLRLVKNRKYSYQLMIAPELFGPIFWLDQLKNKEFKNIIGTIMLKSVGNSNNLKLQESYNGDSILDKIAHEIFTQKYKKYVSGKFRTIYGNDETVFEAPPYYIPSISITRWPFKEYHTNSDTPEKINNKKLEDTVDTLMSIFTIIERNKKLKTNFKGLVCLSKLNLYKEIPEIDRNKGIDYFTTQGRWNQLMNGLPSYIKNGKDILSISNKYKLPFIDVANYLNEWEKNKLLIEIK